MEEFKKIMQDYLREEYENPIHVGTGCEDIKRKINTAIAGAAYQAQTEENLALMEYGYVPIVNSNIGSIAKVADEEKEFSVNDNGVWYDNNCICNFTVIICDYCILYDDSDCCVKKMYTIQIMLSKKLEVYEEVGFEELRSPEFYRSRPEFSNIVVNNSGLFKKYIDNIISNCNLNAERIWIHSGWHKIDGRFYYLDHKGVVGYSGIRARSQQKTDIGHVGCLSVQDMNRLLNVAGGYSIMLNLYSIISMLYSLYKEAGYPPKLLMFLTGKTNSGKTSLALALTKVLCRTEGMQSPDFTFQGTQAGLEQGIKEHHDLVYYIDDLHPSEDPVKQRNMEKNLETLVKLFGDAIMKNRNTDYLDAERAAKLNYKVNGGALLTGEYFAGVESNLSRMIIMQISRDCINFKELTEIQKDSDILLRFYKYIIVYATDNQQEIIEYIKLNVPAIRDTYIENKVYSLPRFAECQGLFKVALNILCNAMNNMGIDTKIFNSQAATYIDTFIKYSDNLVHVHSKEYAIKNAILEFINNKTSGALNNISAEFIDNDEFICILPDDARMIVNTWVEEQGHSMRFMTKGVFIKECLSNGLILSSSGETKKDGKTHVRNTHHLEGHGNKRFLFFLKKALGI